MEELQLSKIVAEGTTQARQYDEGLAQRYAEAMKDGAVFPPVVVFANGTNYYLADGFHRLAAAKANKLAAIRAEIRQPMDGESAQRSAILYAVGANDEHGQNRTNADKRHAVEMLLRDPVWSTWTDREIARQCRVSNNFVSTQRTRLINGGVLKREDKRKRKDKHGNVSEINTEKIGKSTKREKLTPEQKKVATETKASVERQAKAKDEPAWSHADQHGYDLLKSAWRNATKAAREKFLAEVA